jgi:hypothetical protein
VTVRHIKNGTGGGPCQHIHPAHSDNYKMAFSSSEENSAFGDWIRHAPHVSRLFRKELGDASWSRAAVCSIQHPDWKHIPAVLQDRPLVHTGIKNIQVTIEVGMLDMTVPQFPTWYQTMSRNVKLEYFQISFYLTEDGIERFLLGTGPLA